MRHLFSRFTDRFAVLVPKSARATAQIDLIAAILYGLFGGLTTPFIPVIGRRMGANGRRRVSRSFDIRRYVAWLARRYGFGER